MTQTITTLTILLAPSMKTLLSISLASQKEVRFVERKQQQQQQQSLAICVCRLSNEPHLSLGNPLPIVKWYRGDALLTDSDSHSKTAAVSKSVVRNVASFPRLLREHLMMPLTCEASNNNNLTVPVTKTVLIDLNRKWTLPLLTLLIIKNALQWSPPKCELSSPWWTWPSANGLS